MSGKAENLFIEIIYMREIPDFQSSWISSAQVAEHALIQEKRNR